MFLQKKIMFLIAAFAAVTAFIPLNSASQWVSQLSGSDQDLYAVHFLNDNTGLIGSASTFYDTSGFRGGEILRTTNAGENWSRVLLDLNLRVKSFTFIDGITGYAVGGSYATQGYLYRTTNSGINWSDIPFPSIHSHFYNMQFVSSSIAFLAAFDGVYRSIDAGASWIKVATAFDSPTGDYSWRKLFFTDANTGFYSSDSGKIRKTTDSGMSWSLSYVRSDLVVRDIYFINPSTGFLTGKAGILLRTTNSGDSWVEVPLGTNAILYSIKFPNQFIGFIAAEGKVFKSYNSGSSWQEVFDQNNDSLLGAYFLNPDIGYIAGKHGKIYKTISGGVIGINNISGEVPKEFTLSQNYPNPFNPQTMIQFSVPKAAFVKLAVYDMLGREVSTLINQQVQAGKYEVSWNAAEFSSGIYLYKLTAGDFNMVKKMSLIK